MRKEYIIPEINVSMIECAPLLIVSMEVNNENTDTVIEDANDILSRGSNSWDDEY